MKGEILYLNSLLVCVPLNLWASHRYLREKRPGGRTQFKQFDLKVTFKLERAKSRCDLHHRKINKDVEILYLIKSIVPVSHFEEAGA